jgi:hypothetical protein
MIIANRRDKDNSNPTIGCIVLTNPIFFKEEDGIATPSKIWVLFQFTEVSSLN